jgi:hypothetical protein
MPNVIFGWVMRCLAVVLACAPLAACSSGNQTIETSSMVPATTASSATASILPFPNFMSPVVERQLADTDIVPAVNLYRMKRSEPLGPFERAGADLNGDGVPEAIVYLETDTCLRNGCPLVVFSSGPGGYVAVSRTEGVMPPIEVAPAGVTTKRMRDLIVRNGLGKTVRLVWGDAGYPGDASVLQVEQATGETLIAGVSQDQLPSALASTTKATRRGRQRVQSFAAGADSNEGGGGQ